MYAERDTELQQARLQLEAQRTQLEAAQAQLARLKELPKRAEAMARELEAERARARRAEERSRELEIELTGNEEDRRDLSSALASVEAELPELKARLQEELRARSEVAEELIGAKEALGMAQDRVAELATTRSELEGSLEAVQEQAEKLSQENARLQAENERVQLELPTVVAERDAALTEQEVLRADLEAATSHASTLEATAAELRGQLEALEAEKDWSQSSQAELESRVRSLEQEKEEALAQKAAADAALSELEERAFHDVETARAEARVAIEAAAGAANEAANEEKAALEAQLAQTREELESVQIRATSESEARAFAEAELTMFRGQIEGLTDELARLHRELEPMLVSAGPEIVHALREELAQAQRELKSRASSGSGSGELESSQRELGALRADKAAWAAEREKFVTKLQMLEMALEAKHARANVPHAVAAPPAELIAERDKLRSDVAAMKKRLVAAENAIETAAMLKAKVAKLEAALKGRS